MNEKVTKLNPTHEVAACEPDIIVAPRGTTWEPCVLLSTTKTCHDVKIFAKGETVEVKGVPKRFVRPIQSTKNITAPRKHKRKRCSTYGWNSRETELLEEAKLARVQALLTGSPASQPNAFVRDYLARKGVHKR